MNDNKIALYSEACNLFTQFLVTENEMFLQCANELYNEYVALGGTRQLQSFLIQMKRG